MSCSPTMTTSALLLMLTASAYVSSCSAFAPPPQTSSAAAATASPPRLFSSSALFAEENDENNDSAPEAAHRPAQERRVFLRSAAVAGGFGFGLLAGTTTFGAAEPAWALVKGNAPPPKKEKTEKKCASGNLEECQEMAERLASQQAEENVASLAANPPKTAPKGSRYREVEPSPDGESAKLAKAGDDVSVRYKVLKLGKRSYDGLSGEGTVVFSRGYGLEDDETKAGDKTFDFKLGSTAVIEALNDAVPGMAVGSTRRIAVLPQMGWRKPGQECEGGPGGSGTGGDLKTDYVVVPTATMVAEEACFDKNRLPFPTSYAQQRRMAQRFDQSLIVEVALVKIN